MNETSGPDLGTPVPDWRPPPRPAFATLDGQWMRLERLDVDAHLADLWAAFSGPEREALFDYLPYGPFPTEAAHRAWAAENAAGADPRFYAIRPRGSGRVEGAISYLRIAPAAGSIEIGHICFAPTLQRQPAATEAMTALIAWAFRSGYRRLEWKCNALNGASRRAALRLGLSYEGVFRQAAVFKARNRDTAWYAAIDAEWPALAAAYDAWLAPENFDGAGRQHRRLSDLTAPIPVSTG